MSKAKTFVVDEIKYNPEFHENHGKPFTTPAPFFHRGGQNGQTVEYTPETEVANMDSSQRPKKCLEYYGRVYPEAWKQVDQFRSERGKELPWWPQWCYLPMAAAYAIVSKRIADECGMDMNNAFQGKSSVLIADVSIIAALAAWRVTQGIYSFDPDVYQAIIETPVTGDIPHDVLFGLPEWCVYIETPELEIFGKRLHGFFTHLEYDVNDGRKELRFLLDIIDDTTGSIPALAPQIMHLGPWSLKESINRMIQESIRVSESSGGANPFEGNPEYRDKASTLIGNEIQPLVSLVLYLCSANCEINGERDRKPQYPQPVKTKKGKRIFPPSKVTTWDVGVRMGAAIRKVRNEAQREPDQREQVNEQARRSPRAHIRRSHWHGYWTGPKNDPDARKFILNWISPVLVGEGEDMPITIHPVK